MEPLRLDQGIDAPSLEELVQLCAIDSALFTRQFFPRTARMLVPPMHKRIWSYLDDPDKRLCNIQVFRGGAKTSLLRVFTAKRIAYGLAHTILYVGKSEGHANRSIKWLRRAVEFNSAFSQTFNLRPGQKWQENEAEIYHGTDEYPIWILGAGISGSIRGINFDDYRPDLIVIDDVIDEENAATPEQREKIRDLILGALVNGLAPATESPDAKIGLLQTPLNREDASCQAFDHPMWDSLRIGCWAPETENLPLEYRESSWPERYPAQQLRKEKEAALHINKLSTWVREMECKLIAPETSAFKPDWLKFYGEHPEQMTKVLVIDPVPPPSELQIKKGLRDKDYEALTVVGRHKNNYYLLEYSHNRGHEPNWTINEFFRLRAKWRPRNCIVESVAYQRTLAWLLKKAMKTRGQYTPVIEMTDRRSKYDRIVDALAGPASNGALWVRREHGEFIQQFNEYPDVNNEDVLETVAVGVEHLSQSAGGWDEIEEEEEDIPALTYSGGPP